MVISLYARCKNSAFEVDVLFGFVIYFSFKLAFELALRHIRIANIHVMQEIKLFSIEIFLGLIALLVFQRIILGIVSASFIFLVPI